jgi:hypothetical protein
MRSPVSRSAGAINALTFLTNARSVEGSANCTSGQWTPADRSQQYPIGTRRGQYCEFARAESCLLPRIGAREMEWSGNGADQPAAGKTDVARRAERGTPECRGPSQSDEGLPARASGSPNPPGAERFGGRKSESMDCSVAKARNLGEDATGAGCPRNPEVPDHQESSASTGSIGMGFFPCRRCPPIKGAGLGSDIRSHRKSAARGSLPGLSGVRGGRIGWSAWIRRPGTKHRGPFGQYRRPFRLHWPFPVPISAVFGGAVTSSCPRPGRWWPGRDVS